MGISSLCVLNLMERSECAVCACVPVLVHARDNYQPVQRTERKEKRGWVEVER